MKRVKFLGMLAIVLVLGMAVLGACASTGGGYDRVQEEIKPDARSAVVYFYGYKSCKAQVWDGETPVGTFRGGPTVGGIVWKTTPGNHTFVARSTNYANFKMNLQAGKTYYINVFIVPGPGTMVAMRELNEEQNEVFRRRYSRTVEISFSDEWREDFVTVNNGKWLKDMQAHLKKGEQQPAQQPAAKAQG